MQTNLIQCATYGLSTDWLTPSLNRPPEISVDFTIVNTVCVNVTLFIKLLISAVYHTHI